MKKPHYVHFEGMDLAGKTTATRGLAESTGHEWNVRRNTLTDNDDNEAYNLTDAFRRADAYNSDTLGYLYVGALRADLERYKDPEVDTIQDSTILMRSMAHYMANGRPRLVEAFAELRPAHPSFDKSFILTAGIEVRQTRLQQRMRDNPEEISPDDMLVIRNPEKFMRMERALVDLAQTAFSAQIIDTTSLAPSEVISIVREGVFGDAPNSAPIV